MSPHPDPDSRSALGSRRLLESLAACLLARWDELLRMRFQALAHFDIDQIHDLRVACRRLRGAVEQLGPLIGAERTNRLRRPLRQLTRELGLLRNLDESRRYFERFGEGLAPLLSDLARERSREAEQALRMLDRLDCVKLERRIRSAASALVTPQHIASQGLLALLSERNLALYRPVYDLLPLVAAPDRAEERHALRIAVKRWRYFTELVLDILGRPQTAHLRLLRRYQSVLGDLNDREVFSLMLHEAPDLRPQERQKAQKRIAREQRTLMQQFCRLLTDEPLSYRFEVTHLPPAPRGAAP